MEVVGADQVRRAFDGGPPPTGSDHDRDGGVGAQVRELAGSACGDEADCVGAGERMGEDPGVHDGGVRAVVGAERDDDAQAVVEADQLSEGCEIHGSILAHGGDPCGVPGSGS